MGFALGGADGASATALPATSAPVDHASRASWGRTARPPSPPRPRGRAGSAGWETCVAEGTPRPPEASPGLATAPVHERPLTPSRNWQVEPTYLGVYLARERGHFESLGLDVEIVESSGANAAAAAVAAGRYPICDRLRRGDPSPRSAEARRWSRPPSTRAAACGVLGSSSPGSGHPEPAPSPGSGHPEPAP